MNERRRNEEEGQPAATAQRLDEARFEFRVASSGWLTRERSAKKNFMPKTNLKDVIQDGLPILADIEEILTTWSANDASMFLKAGAVLLAIAKVENEDEDDHGPFRYALGWRRSAVEPPESWKKYNHLAGS